MGGLYTTSIVVIDLHINNNIKHEIGPHMTTYCFV